MRVRLGGPFLYTEMAVESCQKPVSVAEIDNKKISKRELKRVKMKNKRSHGSPTKELERKTKKRQRHSRTSTTAQKKDKTVQNKRSEINFQQARPEHYKTRKTHNQKPPVNTTKQKSDVMKRVQNGLELGVNVTFWSRVDPEWVRMRTEWARTGQNGPRTRMGVHGSSQIGPEGSNPFGTTKKRKKNTHTHTHNRIEK